MNDFPMRALCDMAAALANCRFLCFIDVFVLSYIPVDVGVFLLLYVRW